MPERGLVVIPTYNEAANLAHLVPQVLAQDPRLDLLIVDDNSPDGTGQLAEALRQKEPRLSVIHREGKLGLGTAYIAGFRWALERDYAFVFEMDADYSHDPVYLKDFLKAIAGADLVLGSRYVAGNVAVVNWPMLRLMLSYMANIYARWVTGLRVWDLTGGVKCFCRQVLEAGGFLPGTGQRGAVLNQNRGRGMGQRVVPEGKPHLFRGPAQGCHQEE